MEDKKKDITEDIAKDLTSLIDNIAKSAEGLKRIYSMMAEYYEKDKEYYEKNKKAFDLTEEWPEITGMSLDELNNMEVWEILELVNKKLAETINYYNMLPTSALTDAIKRMSIAASNNRDIKTNKNIKINTMETLNGKYLLSYNSGKEQYEVSIDNAQAIKRKQSAGLRKTLNFLLIKANEQHYPEKICFSLDEYMKTTGISSKDGAYRAAKREIDILLGFKITGTIKRGKKEVRNAMEYVFTGRDISYNQCYVKCMPRHVEMLCQYFTLLPIWAGELKTKAYDLLDYIYYLARQNTGKLKEQGYFNISLKAINDYIGGYDPNETQRHEQFIIRPLLDAIEEIEDTQKNSELKITPFYNFDYKNAYDFLDGYLKIELEPEALKYYKKYNKHKNKKNIKGKKQQIKNI